ncbi:MAG: hypothetical protein ACD_41C00152G0009 [uncultured bacterium]|nr:MAG: hypothetical protein ACD_41C00152G0009 [uncultured bacterium]
MRNKKRPYQPASPTASQPSSNGPRSSKKGFIEMQGEVTEMLPNAMFRITLDGGHPILGILAGKMRMHKIKVLPGDHVTVEMTPYDLSKGRIIYRH